MNRGGSTAERRPIIIITAGTVERTQLERLGATVIESDDPLLLVRRIKRAIGIDLDSPSWAELELERAIWGRR